MYMGDVVGCQEVPEPICPRFMTFDSLAPIRTPMLLPDITSSGLVFIEFLGRLSSVPFVPLISMPGILPTGLADGLGDGIGISIFCGEVCGLGETAGIGMPGMADGVGAGVAERVGDGLGLGAGGIFMPGMSWALISNDNPTSSRKDNKATHNCSFEIARCIKLPFRSITIGRRND